MPFDYHVHSTRSDGRLSLEDRAASAALRPHGISDHFPHGAGLRTDDDLLRYRDEAGRLGLLVGIEYDLGVAPALRPSTRESLDYVIGSIHQVFRAGERIGYDLAGAYLKAGRRGTYAERDRFVDPELRRLVLERTLELVREGIEGPGLDIVGHPTFTPLAALGDPEDAYPVDWQERFIALCVAHDVAIEVNQMYAVPHPAFLVRARRAGARFAVGSDAHGELEPLDRTVAMIDAAGLARDRFLRGDAPLRRRASR